MQTRLFGFLLLSGVSFWLATPAKADFFFSTGDPDGKIATLSRTASPGKLETETADDFVTTAQTTITNATFTGLLVGGATPANITMSKSSSITCSRSIRPPRRITGSSRTNSPSDNNFAAGRQRARPAQLHDDGPQHELHRGQLGRERDPCGPQPVHRRRGRGDGRGGAIQRHLQHAVRPRAGSRVLPPRGRSGERRRLPVALRAEADRRPGHAVRGGPAELDPQ